MHTSVSASWVVRRACVSISVKRRTCVLCCQCSRRKPRAVEKCERGVRFVRALHERIHLHCGSVCTANTRNGHTVSIFVGFAASPKAGTDNRRRSQLQGHWMKSNADPTVTNRSLPPPPSLTPIPHPVICSPSLLTKIADSSSA